MSIELIRGMIVEKVVTVGGRNIVLPFIWDGGSWVEYLSKEAAEIMVEIVSGTALPFVPKVKPIDLGEADPFIDA